LNKWKDSLAEIIAAILTLLVSVFAYFVVSEDAALLATVIGGSTTIACLTIHVWANSIKEFINRDAFKVISSLDATNTEWKTFAESKIDDLLTLTDGIKRKTIRLEAENAFSYQEYIMHLVRNSFLAVHLVENQESLALWDATRESDQMKHYLGALQSISPEVRDKRRIFIYKDDSLLTTLSGHLQQQKNLYKFNALCLKSDDLPTNVENMIIWDNKELITYRGIPRRAIWITREKKQVTRAKESFEELWEKALSLTEK